MATHPTLRIQILSMDPVDQMTKAITRVISIANLLISESEERGTALESHIRRVRLTRAGSFILSRSYILSLQF